MIRLILMDVDGTLVGSEGVHPSTWPALDRARDRGVLLGLITGRLGRGVAAEYAARVSPDGLHVFQNGAVIAPPEGPAAHVVAMAPAAFRELVAISRREAEPLEAYGQRRFYLERHSELTRVHERALRFEAEIVDLLAIGEPVVRAQWVVHESRWPRFRALTEPLGLGIQPAVAPWSPGTVFANLTHPSASKAAALRWLAAHHGFDPAEVAMVGDADNDLGAMAASGLAIAMGNARPEVQSRAAVVVGHVDAGGLAEAIEASLDPAR